MLLNTCQRGRVRCSGHGRRVSAGNHKGLARFRRRLWCKQASPISEAGIIEVSCQSKLSEARGGEVTGMLCACLREVKVDSVCQVQGEALTKVFGYARLMAPKEGTGWLSISHKELHAAIIYSADHLPRPLVQRLVEANIGPDGPVAEPAVDAAPTATVAGKLFPCKSLLLFGSNTLLFQEVLFFLLLSQPLLLASTLRC